MKNLQSDFAKHVQSCTTTSQSSNDVPASNVRTASEPVIDPLVQQPLAPTQGMNEPIVDNDAPGISTTANGAADCSIMALIE